MEILFENCCTLTKDALLSMNRKSRNPVFVAAVIVLCAAYLVNGVRAAMAGYPTGLIAPIACAVGRILPCGVFPAEPAGGA